MYVQCSYKLQYTNNQLYNLLMMAIAIGRSNKFLRGVRHIWSGHMGIKVARALLELQLRNSLVISQIPV